MSLLDRLYHSWNVFKDYDSSAYKQQPVGNTSYGFKPDTFRLKRVNERSIIASIYNRIALDVAAIDLKHCQMDANGRFKEELGTKLNQCLTVSTNIDQTPRAFIQDVVMSLLDEGCVAIVPTETVVNPRYTDSYDIESLRVGKILEWHPKDVKVELYDENDGRKKEVLVPKRIACIVENPFYAVMNERNSTLQRLNHKLALLDVADERTASGKLDLIIQLPYVVKSTARQEQAEKRRKAIEMQLTESQYGIAYTDGTERITQLNRPVENKLFQQVEYLTNFLFSQLGITQSILDGTADEKTMLNYYTRTIEPIVAAIVDEMNRKFLTKTARTQHKAILYFRDPFKLTPVSELADTVDKFTRNCVLTSNEIRAIMGFKPADDPNADKLINSNLNHKEEAEPSSEEPPIEEMNQNE